MLGLIARYELRNLIADRTLWLVVLLFATLIGYGTYNGTAWARSQCEAVSRLTREEDERLAGVKRKFQEIEQAGREVKSWEDPRNPTAAGRTLAVRHAVMPQSPLASLAVGQSDLLPSYYEVSSYSKQSVLSRDELENPTNLLAGRFDLAFVIVYLLPLLIFTLSYNVISAEREGGTLAMLLSQPVSLRSLALGKIALRGAVVLVLALGFSLAGIIVTGTDLSSGQSALSLLLWVTVVAAYSLFWFALAVLVNAFGRGSAMNAIALLGAWLLFVAVVPSVANVAVAALYPAPSRATMIRESREASREVAARESQLLAKYYEDHPELVAARGGVDMEDYALAGIATQEELDSRLGQVIRPFEEQLARQQEFVDGIRFLSPAIIAQEALNDLAGTSVSRHRHFLTLLDEYHREWKRHFNTKAMQKQKMEALDYDAVPRFEWAEEPFGVVARRVGTGLLGLLVPTLLIGALALEWLRRYRVAG